MSFYQQRVGRRNLKVMYTFTGISRLWFDGGLWLIYFQHQGLTIFQVGMLEAVLHIVCLASDVPLGMFADRFGWKVALSCSSICGVIYTLLALEAHNFTISLLAFVFRAMQVTLSNGSDSSVTYESAKWAGLNEQYLAVSGRMFAVGLVSMGIAEFAGGALANWSWNALYIAYMVANLASFFVTLRIKEPREERTEGEHLSIYMSAKVAIHFTQQSSAFTRWIGYSGVLFGCLATFAFYGQSLLLHHGWTLIGIGFLSGIENGIGALISAMSAKINRSFGERRTVVMSSILSATGILVFAWVPGIFSGMGYLINSCAGNIAEPIVDQSLNQIVPSKQRATLLSFNSTAFSMFMIVIFPLYGLLMQKFGLSDAGYVGSVVATVGIVVTTLWWWSGESRRN